MEEYIAIACNDGQNGIRFAHEDYVKNKSENEHIKNKNLRVRHYICAQCNRGKFFYIVKTKKLSWDKCSYCDSSLKIDNNFYNDYISCDVIPHSL